MTRADVVVVGAGHNGLVAATVLARAGLDVLVLEAADVVGGACRTEHPFPKVPGLAASTGAYLLGLMPPEIEADLGLDLPLVRRDPHYFLPTTGERYLLFGAGASTPLADADARADAALQAELAALREDLGPAWLAEPLTVEETAERYVRPALRGAFVALCRGSVVEYLDRFGFSDELLVAMYVVTDGLSGLAAGPDDPGTGHNFLVHNMGRLPGSDGTWMIVRGGMGTVTGRLADRARSYGARVMTGAAVAAVTTGADGAVDGVALADGTTVAATAVLACCDPYRLAEIAPLPADVRALLDRARRPGSTLKVNLALRGLPTFTCLPDDRGQHSATMHLLPPGGLDAVRAQWADVQAGRLPDFPTIEWYVHSTADPSLRDAAGHHTAALFVQSVPYAADWDTALGPYVEHLLSLCDRFAPGTSELVADTFPLPPPAIERHFGIRHGHIHHVDNTVAFADRMPYATGVPGLYAGGAGCHPAGSVIGAAGWNSARRVLRDLGRG